MPDVLHPEKSRKSKQINNNFFATTVAVGAVSITDLTAGRTFQPQPHAAGLAVVCLITAIGLTSRALHYPVSFSEEKESLVDEYRD